MNPTNNKNKTTPIELSPGDILDEIFNNKTRIARYIVLSKEETADITKNFPNGKPRKRIIYNLYLIWCDEMYRTERYRPGAYWTIDNEDLSFEYHCHWDIVYKSPLSWPNVTK